MPVKTNEREYRDINLKGMELRTMDDGQMVVDGYATTWEEYLLWEEDGYRVYEKFDPHAFDKCDRSDIIMQLNHEGRVYARGGNKTLVVAPDENGLRITAYLGGTEEGRKIFEEIKGGYLTKMSHGFRKKTDRREVIEDHETGMIEVHRIILEVAKEYDVSVVSLPANEATSISARSFSEGVIAEVKQERLAVEARRREKTKIAIMAEMI
ncbi:MAG: HK97 family phage prohead protease [Lachnospiraceae bacterium]|nr:HK97 family phage prohead protease [Lachnospiraceae bacterium]